MHTTFQYAGTEGKRHRLREAMVFYDPPEYYDTPGSNYFEFSLMDLFLELIACQSQKKEKRNTKAYGALCHAILVASY